MPSWSLRRSCETVSNAAKGSSRIGLPGVVLHKLLASSQPAPSWFLASRWLDGQRQTEQAKGKEETLPDAHGTQAFICSQGRCQARPRQGMGSKRSGQSCTRNEGSAQQAGSWGIQPALPGEQRPTDNAQPVRQAPGRGEPCTPACSRLAVGTRFTTATARPSVRAGHVPISSAGQASSLPGAPKAEPGS